MPRLHARLPFRNTLVIALLAAGIAIGVGVDRVALAQQQPSGIKRTMLLRTDEPGSQTHEALMAVAEIAPGATVGRHRHPGIEIGYVLEGSVRLEQEGKPLTVLKAGDSFNTGTSVHNATNAGKVPVKILVVYLVEKGKPVAEPVP